MFCKLIVKRSRSHPLSIEIDNLTNSIEHAVSGEVFSTLILPFTSGEKNYRKREWVFDWKRELSIPEREVYKIVLDNTNAVQGLISLTDNGDHVFINLVEVAKFNRGNSRHITAWQVICSLLHASSLSPRGMVVL